MDLAYSLCVVTYICVRLLSLKNIPLKDGVCRMDRNGYK